MVHGKLLTLVLKYQGSKGVGIVANAEDIGSFHFTLQFRAATLLHLVIYTVSQKMTLM